MSSRLNSYNFNHLYYFYVIASQGNMTAASEVLNTSQPSLSVQMKALESALQRPLFTRAKRKIELTKFGQELLSYCKKGFETFEEMGELFVDSKVNSPPYTISIGVSMEIDRPFVAEVIGKITRSQPKEIRPKINLVSLDTATLNQMLRSGEVDLLLSTKATIDHDIELLFRYSLPVGCFGNSEIYQASQRVRFEAILRDRTYGVALPAHSTQLRAEIEQYFLKKRIRPNCLFESNILAAVIRATVDGVGMTIAPQAYVWSEIKSRKLFYISDSPLWRHQLILLSKKGRFRNNKAAIVRHFAEELESMATLTWPRKPLAAY